MSDDIEKMFTAEELATQSKLNAYAFTDKHDGSTGVPVIPILTLFQQAMVRFPTFLWAVEQRLLHWRMQKRMVYHWKILLNL
ncbi:MAG: hypothetical protein ACE5OZ_18030 [Candidatus Heimdallarchaeota archaeon]